MKRPISLIFDDVIRHMRIMNQRVKGHHLEEVIDPPRQDVFRNKSPGNASRYKPAPCNPPRGKRRRQWR